MHNHLPRITIKYCTQCKWLLRAAYFAQELLSTFSTQLGEVALVPATGGTGGEDVDITGTILWDRKTNGGFPEVKVLKSLVRNVVDPSRDLGHTDRALRAANVPVQSRDGDEKVVGKSQEQESTTAAAATATKGEEKCEECQ
ncbi:uncharacterized protein An01g04440 [Aspergillus niger]|uniref:Contig An01c0160, genomic contig n=2 Tax=Aspergillus niger TaxID=5061 RepID=A2Q8I2_ASPNC|nr:uncharacterized protein An01g04440 [Aspergillus niger]CAK36979.1 unnamed protein product [Aspergillus niger]